MLKQGKFCLLTLVMYINLSSLSPLKAVKLWVPLSNHDWLIETSSVITSTNIFNEHKFTANCSIPFVERGLWLKRW